MKTILSVLLIVTLTGCCRQDKPDPAELIATDKAFSQMSVEKGLNAAFIYYADDSVTKVREGNFPLTGKDTMTKIYLSRPDTGMILKWYPVRAEVSRSNDMGYTFGNWELYVKAKDTTMYGNYISIWKKQHDGTWKYVLDAGSNTPKPE
jgi:ketosteroid isomerase-like protein